MILISSKLRSLRIEKNLKQAQVAEKVGVNKSAISAYENDLRQPSYDVLVKLAKLYKVSVDYLLGMKPARTLDVSELTDEEIAVLDSLIAMLTKTRK